MSGGPSDAYLVDRTQVVLLCIASCLLNWHFFLLRGNTNGLLSALFSECGSDAVHVRTAMCHTGNSSVWSTASTLLTAAGVKFALTACTATAAVPGGTLVPSLAIGGLIGRAVGLGMESLQRHYGEVGIFAVCGRTTQCITPGVYAMVGAASLLGGVTRMTVSLVVIMFELTGGLEYMLPIMVAVMVSKWVGDACGKESMYDLMVAVKGYPYLDTKAEVCHTVLKAEDVMTACPLDAVPLSGNTSISIGALLQVLPLSVLPCACRVAILAFLPSCTVCVCDLCLSPYLHWL